MFGITSQGGPETNPAQIPRPAGPVTVTPLGQLDNFLKFDAEDKMATVTNGTETKVNLVIDVAKAGEQP